MTEKSKRTFVEAKKIYGINEKAREGSKESKGIKKMILKILQEEPSTIPQLAKALGLPEDVIMYHLMTCRKYGQINVNGMDDMDEYFVYSMKKDKKDGED
jgi:hypothetical protein